eukprot:PhF_6_TR31368/c2_g1_i3/m.45928
MTVQIPLNAAASVLNEWEGSLVFKNRDGNITSDFKVEAFSQAHEDLLDRKKEKFYSFNIDTTPSTLVFYLRKTNVAIPPAVVSDIFAIRFRSLFPIRRESVDCSCKRGKILFYFGKLDWTAHHAVFECKHPEHKVTVEDLNQKLTAKFGPRARHWLPKCSYPLPSRGSRSSPIKCSRSTQNFSCIHQIRCFAPQDSPQHFTAMEIKAALSIWADFVHKRFRVSAPFNFKVP